MHILDKSKKAITTGAVGVSAFAVIAAPGAAFAHGGWSDGSRSNRDNSQTASTASSSTQNNRGDNLLPCDQQQQILNQKAADAQARYQKQLTGLNIMLSGVQTYVSSGNVSVDNYDQLNAKATASQTDATNAVNAIKAPQLECASGTTNMVQSSDVNTNMRDLQSSIRAARQAIYTYRQDVNTLFEAVINGSTTNND